jgi:group II intron reverse transcriptase/maturase
MRTAETILTVIRNRGLRGLQVEGVYRSLFNRNLYLCAYGKLYRNKGAMTEGATPETVDGMTLEKIDNIIELLRYERYRWTPVRRTYIPKKNKKLRALSLPTWSDKLLQEVIRLIMEAYYDPQFSDCSHGFRPNRGCHTALRRIVRMGKGTKWFIEGDISSCFDKIDHAILLETIKRKFQDNRFIRLLSSLLKAGYLEDWKFNTTYSGVPAGSILGPILSNIVLDRFDKHVEKQIIPANTRGKRRRKNPAYQKLWAKAYKQRKQGNWESAIALKKQMQVIPSGDPNDLEYRRLWYVRYADDFLLGYIGVKNEAVLIKHEISKFLCNELKLELNAEKTLVTHARDERARFLGYEVHTLHEDSKHDKDGDRCINSVIGLKIPMQVRQEKCARYTKHGKPAHIPQKLKEEAYSIVAQYQAEYRGIVQYYRMAYNLHLLSKLRYIAGISLVKTLASKYKTTCAKIYQRYGTKIETKDGKYEVILVTVKREAPKKPLTAYFGGISLRWDKVASYIEDKPVNPIIWNNRSDLVQRLLAQECEVCGSRENIEVHHIRKLADLQRKGQTPLSTGKKLMIARKRKTLVVCRRCHDNIHGGRYDGKKLSV